MRRITQKFLKKKLKYYKRTGTFVWKSPIPSSGVKPGDIVGTKLNGYLCVKLNGRKFYTHRLAFLYVTGKMPPKSKKVDHINGVKTDNRWKNLRLVSSLQNNRNRKEHRERITGVRLTKWGTWEARLQHNKRTIHMGTFKTRQEAVAARRKGERMYWRKVRPNGEGH